MPVVSIGCGGNIIHRHSLCLSLHQRLPLRVLVDMWSDSGGPLVLLFGKWESHRLAGGNPLADLARFGWQADSGEPLCQI